MALFNSPVITVAIIDQSALLQPVFTELIGFMSQGGFEHEFEMRRVIFGLISLLKHCSQPVSQYLPDIGMNLATLSKKVHRHRLKTVKENERFIASGFGRNGVQDSSDDGDDDDEDNSADSNALDTQQPRMNSDEDAEEESSSDGCDYYEYEEVAGETSLYDSPLETSDELIIVKEVFDSIYRGDQNAFEYLTSKLSAS